MEFEKIKRLNGKYDDIGSVLIGMLFSTLVVSLWYVWSRRFL